MTVCAGSCGPGNLHLINGLFDAHRSRVPVLAIAAQIGPLRRMTGMSRTADLGALDYAARCHEGPVWGSRAAAMVILAIDRCGPTAIASRWKF